MGCLNKIWAGQHFLLICLFLFSFKPVLAQRNLSGKSGLLFIPDAEPLLDGTWVFGYQYNPVNYSLRMPGRKPERVLYTGLNILPRLELTFLLLHPLENGKPIPRYGIGDRQLDLRYQLIYEKKYLPALVVGLSSPFTIDAALETNVLVATKTIERRDWILAATLGLGSPYYIYRDEENLSNGNVFSKFTLQKKSDDPFDNKYLVGPFGGLKIGFKGKIHLMMEWDGQKVNSGLHIRLFKRFHLQGGVLNFDQYMFGFHLEQSLKK